jgi:hypothetical protein
MKDTVILGNGKSRVIKAPVDMPSTFEAWRTQLLAGEAYLDVSLNTATTGDNVGVSVVGTPQNKSTLLDDTTKAALELSGADPNVNDALYALSQKTQPVLNVTTNAGVVVTATLGSTVLSATANTNGLAVLYPAEFGTWTISATISGTTLSIPFVIDAIAVFNTTLTTNLEQASWALISAVAEAGNAASIWSVGDVKTISIGGVTYNAQIIGFNHDNKQAGGKAGITWQLKDCLNTTAQMNTSNTNAGGWTSSAMRASTLASVLGQLPEELQSVLKNVNKLTSAGNRSSTINATVDKLFLLSEIEIFGTTTYSFAGEGSQYAYYQAGNTKIKKVNGSADYWWERSPYSSSTADFCQVNSGGAADVYSASSSDGVAFGFCV